MFHYTSKDTNFNTYHIDPSTPSGEARDGYEGTEKGFLVVGAQVDQEVVASWCDCVEITE